MEFEHESTTRLRFVAARRIINRDAPAATGQPFKSINAGPQLFAIKCLKKNATGQLSQAESTILPGEVMAEALRSSTRNAQIWTIYIADSHLKLRVRQDSPKTAKKV